MNLFRLFFRNAEDPAIHNQKFDPFVRKVERKEAFPDVIREALSQKDPRFVYEIDLDKKKVYTVLHGVIDASEMED